MNGVASHQLQPENMHVPDQSHANSKEETEWHHPYRSHMHIYLNTACDHHTFLGVLSVVGLQL